MTDGFDYISPVQMQLGEMRLKMEDDFTAYASQQVGWNIDKDELIKALKYDRQQYEKGFADARKSDSRLQEIAHHYGFEHQREVLVEECAELIQASQKCKRNQVCAFDNFIGELADVKIMVEQMMLLVGTEEVNKVIEQKLERQMRRIKEEK